MTERLDGLLTDKNCMEPEINLKGKVFKLVRVQRDGGTGVYKSDDEFLRIGEKEKIHKDLELHKNMEAGKFPVARLIEEGELSGQYYFIESSLGDNHLGKLFAEDMLRGGTISNKNFETFLKIVESFGKAQLKTNTDIKNYEVFAKGIHLDILCDELPQYSEAILSCFKNTIDKLSVFPFVISHGDLNPNNLYPTGVIDLEDSFYGPFGLDLVTAIVHINYFPDSKEYEYFAGYRFTPEQKKRYFLLIDSIATYGGLSALSSCKTEFEFCRAIWSLVRMDKWPKIQKFRYDLFIKKFLKNYLKRK